MFEHAYHMTLIPVWLSWALMSLFMAGGCFYVVRLAIPSISKKSVGYYDWENEVVHALCMFAMGFAFSPLYNVFAGFFQVTLIAGFIWIVIRALTWGRRLPWNVWWWDWAHAGMLLCMSSMFGSIISNWWFLILQLAFWSWFCWFYIKETHHDLKKPNALFLGSDLSHLTMGIAMLSMTILPVVLMPTSSEAAVTTVHVLKVDDSSSEKEIFQSQQPVIIFVYGGCVKCSEGVKTFDELASEYKDQANLVVVNKNDAPLTAQRLGVTQCPAIFAIKNGFLTATSLTEFGEEAQLRQFIQQAISQH